MHNVRRKILYVITKGNFGGAQRYVFDLATSLPKDTFSVGVVFGESGVLSKKLTEAGIRCIEIPSLKRNVNIFKDLKVFFELILLFKREQPDVVHLNSSKVGALGGLAARIARVPHIIFTGHGWAYNEERALLSKIIIGILHWFTILFSHKTIAVSKQTATQISNFPFVKNKIHVVYNGIANINFYDGFEARQHLASSVDHSIWIGTISELHKNKGLDFLIQAFSEISSLYKDCGLIIVGEGEERESLTKLISSKNLQDRIHLIGYVDQASLYLKAFDIFTLTSRTEAFPYALLEAGIATLPVLGSAVGGIPEIIIDEKTGILTNPGDIEKINSGLSQLLNNESLRISYGKALRDHVSKSFSHERMVNETITLYN